MDGNGQKPEGSYEYDNRRRFIFVRLFGKLDIFSGGKSFFEGVEKSSVPVYLFRFFLHNRGKSFTLAEIAEQISDYSDFIESHREFSPAEIREVVYRLKKIIAGGNGIRRDLTVDFCIEGRDGLFGLELSEHVEVDKTVFEEKVAGLIENGTADERIAACRELLAEYDIFFVKTQIQGKTGYILKDEYRDKLLSLLLFTLAELNLLRRYDDVLPLCESYLAYFKENQEIHAMCLSAQIRKNMFSAAGLHIKELSSYLAEFQIDVSPSLAAAMEEMYEIRKKKVVAAESADEKKNENFWLHISELISEYSTKHIHNYTFGHVKIKPSDGYSEDNFETRLKAAISASIRSNDEFRFIDNTNVLVILCDSRKNYVDVVMKRIYSHLEKHLPEGCEAFCKVFP